MPSQLRYMQYVARRNISPEPPRMERALSNEKLMQIVPEGQRGSTEQMKQRSKADDEPSSAFSEEKGIADIKTNTLWASVNWEM